MCRVPASAVPLASAEGCPRSLAWLKFLESRLIYEAAEMMLDPSEQAIGLIEPRIAGATINVPSPLAKPPRKAKVRSLKPIAWSA
jgi:hypothetical protein